MDKWQKMHYNNFFFLTYCDFFFRWARGVYKKMENGLEAYCLSIYWDTSESINDLSDGEDMFD